jgi:putative transposase
VIYAFIETEKANHPMSAMCRALKVSKSGFYGWRDRAPSARARADALLLTHKIIRIHRDSRETYGAPRIHFELRTLGVRCARKRVARLMREAGLFSGVVGVEGRLVRLCAHIPSVPHLHPIL